MSELLRRVHQEIICKTKGREHPRIFLEWEEWKALRDEVEPSHIDHYGAIVAEEKATKAGYDNFLVFGCPICLVPGSAVK